VTVHFRITHPFHPRYGARYELVTRRHNWGEDRVFYYDAKGTLRSLAANVTDVVPPDPFTQIAAGRSAFRVEDLLALRTLLDRIAQQRQGGGEGVKWIAPHM
jgi:Family of unknown function (DUF5372)